jgi:plastocyanin
MPNAGRIVTFATDLVLALAASGSIARAVQPGVDIAAPRVALVSANGLTLRFEPPTVAVEQGDYVQWNWMSSGSHTTTSGNPCVADLLWSANLTSTTPQFTRQFLESAGARPYFCSPHCGLGMTGSVGVTTVINVDVTDTGGSAALTWTGGGGLYRVFRSDSPLFPSASTVVLTPAGGTNQTSLLDAALPPATGSATFYLVMNQF